MLIGGRTFYTCKVADDENGQLFLDNLQAASVDCHIHKRDEKGTTGTCLVLVTPDADRTLCALLGVNSTLSEADLEPQIIAASSYIYFEAYVVTLPGALSLVHRLREIAEKNGTKTAMSFSDPELLKKHRDCLGEVLSKRIDLLFCNRNEAISWAETEDMDMIIDSLKKIAHTFVITLGDKGALVCDGTKVQNIAPCTVKSVDINGAGDMFAGAFLYAITQGKDFVVAGDLASRASATVVSDYGSRLTREKQQQLLWEWYNMSKK